MKINLTQPKPLAAALEQFDARSPVRTALSSAEIEDLPLAVREASTFSAKLTNLRTLQKIHDLLGGAIALTKTNNGDGVTIDRGKFIETVREVAIAEGLQPEPGELSPIENITSTARLDLIWDMQIKGAQGYAAYAAAHNPNVIQMFPCQELYRQDDRNEPRDWPATWKAAGGEFYGPNKDRMIARIDSEIWTAISRFGRPWPLYDYYSGMWIRSIPRRESVELGVIGRKERVKSTIGEFNQGLQAEAGRLPGGLKDAAEKLFAGTAIERGGRFVVINHG